MTTLLETVLLAVCLNSSCSTRPPTATNTNSFQQQQQSLMQKKLYHHYLEHELKGMDLKIATVQNGALSYAVKINGTWVGKGVAFDLLAILQKKYQFKYTIVLPKENALGTKRTGIFGLLYSKKVDLAAAFLPMTATYWRYAHFASSLDLGEWVVVLKRPQESAIGSGLLAPFAVNVWILILLCLLIIGPIIHLVVNVQSTYLKDDKRIKLMDCMWFVYGALLKQGTTLTPVSDSTRLVFAAWWLFITILTSFYTANLTAFLTLSEFTLPIRTAQDIAEKNYSLVTLSGSIIEESSNNRFEELYNLLKHSEKKFVSDRGANILKTWVTERDYIYIAERPNIDILLYQDYLNKTQEGLTEKQRCTYVLTPWAIFKRPRAFAYSKSFKFGELFDKTLRNLLEVGLTKRFLSQHHPDITLCPLDLGSKDRQLRNTDLMLTYYIVCSGFSIAILTFFIEIIIKLAKRDKKVIKTRRVCTARGLKNKISLGNYEPPPPSYSSIFVHPSVPSPSRKTRYINGRAYWVSESSEGNSVLIPMHTPSALLFQYTN